MTLLGSLVFYGFYREWFSWFLLVSVVLLPLFSLALSLPSMLTVSAGLRCPESVRIGVPLRTALELKSRFLIPPVSSRIRLHNHLTDIRYVGAPGERIPTEHCGMVTIAYDRIFVYDFLGLFCRQLRKGDSCAVYVEPKPIPGGEPPKPDGKAVSAWQPKPGGGFSEDHDLRLYRPGDDLRNIHWKLAAKTGKLIYREPIEPVLKGYLLTMTLCGAPDQMDKKLGQLIWLSQSLLDQGQEHEVRCLTGGETVCFQVRDTASLEEGMRMLLRSRPAKQELIPEEQAVLWQHHIGGDSHEA